MLTAPPVPLPDDCVVRPARKITSPPAAESPSPTIMLIAPPLPLVAAPEARLMSPDPEALKDEPVLSTTRPLMPPAAEFEVASTTSPLEVVEPNPL